MYNPNVGYRGPDQATRSLTVELTERFGKPARTYEFVTGYKSASNVSGHCPDSNGITHGVDIFLTAPQMRWTADHLAARGKAGDRRVLYAIYADQIASASTGWQFMGSGWGHFDHVHLSVWDGYWGGPCTLPASIHGDTSSWGVAGTSPQSNDIIPIPEEGFLMALPEADQNEILTNIRKIVLKQEEQDARIKLIEDRARKYIDSPISAVPKKVLEESFEKKGTEQTGTGTVGGELAYLAGNFKVVNNKIDALRDGK